MALKKIRVRGELILFFLIFIFNACQQENHTHESSHTHAEHEIPVNKKFNRSEQQQLIYDAEKELAGTKEVFDESQALSMINLYSNYIQNFPDDTIKNPEYLFKCAQIQISLKLGESAVKNLTQLIRQFPNHPKTDEAHFLLAFTYDNILKDPAKAQEAYYIFIKKFPHHPLAPSAKANIDIAGKSDDELLKFIKSKSKK